MKSLIASIAILGLLGMAVGVGVGAADITATVTPKIVSISVSETAVGYGVVDVPSTDNVPVTPSANVIIAVENTGNADEDFAINGADATGDTITWNIADASPGTYDYNHKFIDCGVGDSTCSTVEAANNMTETPETLAADVPAASIEYFQLRLSTPTETGGDMTEHSTTVTVLATASS